MNKYQKLLHETYVLTGEGKMEEFKTYLSDKVSWTEAAGFPYAGIYIGPDEVVKNVHERLGTEWEGYAAKDNIYTFNENIVIVYGNYSGTYKLTGKSFIADFCHLYEFDENDKVKKFIQIVDSATVNKALTSN
ncbi:nuclear transport factor 2 family protein [Clostridium estertheticum]|uniref:Ketosteroid isomerase n=1 Tax=Clostridium estertheticum TaxID=238834 RepID=A0AA47EFM1_9CLOT|nr:hypothetical protein [Clostridium estertheticum]MBU3156562.1 hypothetical protein [Clostridium estertheticum]WAG59322.1 hypothetical protein LL038_16975 [Clostridium estertheticum]